MEHVVDVGPSGFSPVACSAARGDTLVFRGLGRADAIVQTDAKGAVKSFYSTGLPPGPMPACVPGLYALGARDDDDETVIPDWVWLDPGFTANYIRLDLDKVNPAPGVYDWSTLTPHLERAVQFGRYLSLSIRAGQHATPQWYFTDAAAPFVCAGVRLPGIRTLFALPQDPNYRERLKLVYKDLRRHLASNAAWWQRLVSICLSGANWHSAEARLPDRPGDAEVWIASGYTADGQIAFYVEFAEFLTKLFGRRKLLVFPLIQSGFPAQGGLIPVDQTRRIITALAPYEVTIQHLGLQAPPPSTKLAHHPITAQSVRAARGFGDGLPNPYCLEAGFNGAPTSGQTVNRLSQVAGGNGFERAVRAALDLTDYHALEVYPFDVARERRSRGDGSFNAPVGDSGKTLAQLGEEFIAWRARLDSKYGPAFPTEHRVDLATMKAGTYYFVLSNRPNVRGSFRLTT